MSDIEREAFEKAKERFFESVEVTSLGAIVGADEALIAMWQAARQAPASGEVDLMNAHPPAKVPEGW